MKFGLIGFSLALLSVFLPADLDNFALILFILGWSLVLIGGIQFYKDNFSATARQREADGLKTRQPWEKDFDPRSRLDDDL